MDSATDPSAFVSSLLTRCTFPAPHTDVTVALSGLGGDELFGGYPSFRVTPRFGSLLPAWRRLPPATRRIVVKRLRLGDTRRRKLADVLEHAVNIASQVPQIRQLQTKRFSVGVNLCAEFSELLNQRIDRIAMFRKDRKSTRLNSSHVKRSRMPSSA